MVRVMGILSSFLWGYAGGCAARPKQPKYLYLQPGERPVVTATPPQWHQPPVSQPALPPAAHPACGTLDAPERPF